VARNAIIVLADSLNRHFLPLYGNDWVKAPNIERLAARGATFTRHYTGSAPCMPSRRELWTGCFEFPWRPWGSCEVFDEHVGALCAQRGAASHLVTDHYHYWERGGANYLEQFDGADFIRGHENDYFVSDPSIDVAALPEDVRSRGRGHARHLRNCTRLGREEDYWSPQVFATAGQWLDRNHAHGPFLLAVECFDPHEPFNVPPPYDTMYGPHVAGETYWPLYGRADRYSPEVLARIRQYYAGKLTMVDAWLGRLLDRLDRHELWDETVVILTTDHGHFLGEHNLLGKPTAYPWQTLFHIPLVIAAPGVPAGVRRDAVSTHVDVYATLLDALGLERSRPGHGRSLLPVARGEARSVRECTVMGYWGEAVGCTDGRWKLHQAPVPGNRPLHAYGCDLVTAPFMKQVPITAEVSAGNHMPHAGRPVLRQPAVSRWTEARPTNMDGGPSLLFDLESDPGEERDLLAARPDEVRRLRGLLRRQFEEIGAPAEQFRRLGLDG